MVQNYDFIYYDVAGTEILYQVCVFFISFSKNSASQSMFEWERGDPVFRTIDQGTALNIWQKKLKYAVHRCK